MLGIPMPSRSTFHRVPVVQCPRCGGMARRWVNAFDRTGGPTVTVLRCRRCGIGFSDADEGAPAASTVLPEEGVGRRVADAILRGELRPAVQRWDRGISVLDVGAGAGNRARVLARAGFDVTAVEPDATEADHAARQLAGIARVIATTIEDLPADAGGFDAALFSHVLEHLPDPEATLRATRERLRPGGEVVVMVPNPGSLEARVFRGRWHGWEPSRHRWHFRADVLADVLRAAGFEHVQARARGGWRYPSTMAFSIAPGLDPQINPGAATRGRLLTVGLVPLARVLELTGRGPQLVATGRRGERPDDRTT